MNKLPVRRTTIISPKRRVISGRVNESKAKLPKISFRPCPSFINSNRKSVHCSNLKNNQIRKEVIKKMVWLTDLALSENKDISSLSSPIKPPVGLTPSKGLRNRNYFLLPEFVKKKTDINELRTPLKDFVKRETISSANRALSFMKNRNLIHDETTDLSINFNTKESNNESKIFELNISKEQDALDEIFKQVQQYNSQVGWVYNKIKSLDEIFVKNIEGLSFSYNEVYNKFQVYQREKEDLYAKMRSLEDNLKAEFDRRLNFGEKLKNYKEEKEKLWGKRMELHKDFETFVQTSMKNNKSENKPKETPKKIKRPLVEEQPKLRRSLRISKIPRTKKEERTPMSKRSKSRGIGKTKK